MAKFTVRLVEKVFYTVEVELDDDYDPVVVSAAAGNAAVEIWCAAEQAHNDFCGESDGVEVCNVQPIEEAEPSPASDQTDNLEP